MGNKKDQSTNELGVISSSIKNFSRVLLAAVCIGSFSFGASADDPKTTKTTNTTATNKTTSTTNVFIIPKTEDGKRASMLQQFIASVDEATLRAIAKKFKIDDKGTVRELRKNVEKYLGLLNVMQDNRKKSEIIIKDLFKTPDLKKNFVVYADEGVHIRSKKDPGSGTVTLRGDQGNLYVKFQSQVISARLIRIDMKRKMIFGEGNAMIKDKDRLIIGDKFYFNSDDQTGVIYNAQTYIKPYFYYGEKIKKIGEKSYVLEKGWLTTSTAARPHFKFGVGKAWLYQDLRLVAVDVTYEVSDFPVFWFPFLFHPMKGTGFHVGLGRDTRVGWFMQVDNVGSFFKLPFDLKFDVYQKMGVAIQGGKDGLKWGNLSLNMKYGIAMDKPLDDQTVPGEWVNTVNGDGERGNETGTYGDWKRELRWKIELNPTFTIYHDKKNKSLGSTTISGKFKLLSDPQFSSEFGGTRVKKIDIEKLYRQEEVSFFSSPGLEGRDWSVNVSDKRGGSTLNVGASWKYQTKLHGENNKFANNRYQYRRSEVVFPSIRYGFSGTILSSSKKSSTTTTVAVGTNTNSALTNSSSGDPLDILDLGAAENQKRDSNANSYSVTYSANFNLVQRRLYDDSDELSSQTYSRGFSLSVPARIKLGPFGASLSLSFSDTTQWGNSSSTNTNVVASYNQVNEAATKTVMTESFSMSLVHIFNKGKLSHFGGSLSVRHSMTYLMATDTEIDTYASDIQGHSMSASASLEFFKTKISTSFAYDLTEYAKDIRNWGTDRMSLSPFSITFQPFGFLSISDTYSYKIQSGLSDYNTLNVNFTSPDFRLPGIEKISKFKFLVTWYHNYNTPTSSYIGINMSWDMKINDLWSITFALSSRNKELYLYNDLEARKRGEEPRNIFKDLIYSLMFWDSDKLKESRFNIQSFSLNLVHDLHDWQMTFSAQANQKKHSDASAGTAFSYFDFRFVFSISMKQNIGIKFPEQRYHYYADTDGKYKGDYN